MRTLDDFEYSPRRAPMPLTCLSQIVDDLGDEVTALPRIDAVAEARVRLRQCRLAIGAAQRHDFSRWALAALTSKVLRLESDVLELAATLRRKGGTSRPALGADGEARGRARA